jgi:uncharacterized protein (DUF2249 family)/iron-sulfur cluster repair protein YtfE (RIC family)
VNATVIASSAADAQAADAIREHHAQMSGALTVAVAAVLTGAEHGSPAESAQAVADLATWCELELLPHAKAEEQTLYATAGSTEQARLLVAAMTAEHQVLTGLVHELASPQSALTARVAAAGALQAMFRSHVAKENDLLVPLLESAPEISLAALLEQMHHRLSPAEEVVSAPAGHACDCGHDDEPGYPVLDAQAIPHAIRHATIVGALAAVQPGGGLTLLAPHDPLPLLDQVEQAEPGRFAVSYLQRGPQTWRLQFVRQL